MKRKILSILLLVVAILALAGCAKKDGEKKENSKHRIQDYISLEYSSKYNGCASLGCLCLETKEILYVK